MLILLRRQVSFVKNCQKEIKTKMTGVGFEPGLSRLQAKCLTIRLMILWCHIIQVRCIYPHLTMFILGVYLHSA